MVLVSGVVVPARVSGQTPEHLQHVEQQLAQKQAAAEAHRKQMEAIKDPAVLNVEMRKHFQMTEEILALMLERRKLTTAATPATPTPPASSAQPPGGMQGGMMGGMRGGMMGGMQRGGEHGGAQTPPGPGMSGGMMEKEMGGMPGGQGMPGMASPPTAPNTPPTSMGDMDQMMKRIGEHSTYMETVKDPTMLQQEMLRHQRMLDQMLQLMQK